MGHGLSLILVETASAPRENECADHTQQHHDWNRDAVEVKTYHANYAGVLAAASAAKFALKAWARD
jgi:hypothetical protein